MQLLLALAEYAHAVAEQSALCTFFSLFPADLTALLWSVGFFSGAALLASVIQAKNTAPEKKPTDHSNALRSAGSREKVVHTALCSATTCAYSASAGKSCTSSKDDILFCVVFPTNIVRNEHFLEISENDFGKLTKV